jgi:membrane dipeptidase
MDRRTFLKTGAGASLAGVAAAALAQQAAAPTAPHNLVIEHARKAALDVIQPTPKQLQHGLELHAASVVCESYGFSPRAALDVEALAKAAEGGAPPGELDDLREEMSMTRCVTDATERAEYMAAWNAAGVTCIFQNVGEECQAPLRILKRLARFTYVTDMLPEFVAKAVRPDDVLRAKKENRHCLLFSANAVPVDQQWASAEGELAQIRIFFQLGIRMMHITYNRRNMLGDGCAEPANAGLSDFGRMAVAEMNRLGVIPDVAHSGWQTSFDTAKASTRPAVISHSTCAGLQHHIRSKPDRVIKAIADTGGYIGICSIASFLGGNGDLRAMLDHIDYAVKRFGADHVAIGTDIAYSSRTPASPGKKLPKSGPSRRRFESFWPPDALKGPPQHASLAWTNWPMFTVGMVARGHSDADIQKILGGNVLRVVRASLA